MKTIFPPIGARPLGVFASVCLAAFGHSAMAETSLVQDFESANWLSDDTRNNLGDNLIGAPQGSPSSGITNAPAEADPAGSSVNLYDAQSAIRSQLYWSDAFYGTKGNLGGVFLNTTAATTPNRMKSTISIVDSAAGLGAVSNVLGNDFEASYRWFVDPTADPTKVALKFGIQSSQWGASQTGFDSQRSGESDWDLLLVYIPAGTPAANSVFTSSVTSTSTTGQWSVYKQAANGYFSAEALIKDFGSASLQQVLQDTTVLSGTTLGSLLSGGKVSSVQFGVGSGTSDQNFVGGVDWAQVSFLNDGQAYDFVDASVWTGADDFNFATAGNWTLNTVNNEKGPTPTNNVIFNDTPASPVVLSSNTQARSVSVANGVVTIDLGANRLELLNDGFLSSLEGAELHLTGSGLVSAAALEAWGRVSLDTQAKFDGGSINQPGRNGRYAIVVAEAGTLDLENGADVSVVNESGAQGVKTLIRVGEDTPSGGTGVMNIKPGSQLTAGSLYGTGSWTGFHVGDWGGTGEVNQTGGTVNLYGAVVIGNEGGSGVYNVSGADSLLNIYRPIDDNGAIIVGRATSNRSANGILNISNGMVVLGASGGAPGSVSLVLGGLSDDVAAYANANGTINQTGGELRFDSGSLIFGRGHGVYNLYGGILSIGGTNGISATPNGIYEMNLGGGTIRVRGSALTTSVNMNLVAGAGGLIDTNNLGATFSGNISGANGAFVKTGLGNLTLSGASRTIGYLNSDFGSITQSAGDTEVTELVVGGNFIAQNGAYILNSGTITVSGTSLVAPTSSFRIGDFGGTGTFIQNGGTVTVGGLSQVAAINIGNQGGSGTYNLNGGTLTLAGGNNVIGRSSDTYPASTGVLNIAGGLLDITNSSALINGNNLNVVNLGTGTINQSGGILRVSDGRLYIAGFGNGTYNLSGGTLEVGGNSLVARYNNTTSVSSFNLGGSANGATVKTIGSALNTSVDWNLVDGTANKEKGTKLDTNNLGSTLSGNIYGAGGGLVKTGLGNLTLSGATRNIGYFNADQGSTVQSAGVTTSTEFVVGSNYSAKNGTFTLNGGSIVMSGSTPDAPTPSFRVGDWGGTGTFTQNAGTVTIGGAGVAAALNIGNQGGSGVYNLNGGTLTLAGGLNILGRSSGSNPASTGVLNITGGLLDITNSSSLINGNNFNVANLGTGTINQSGGTLRVSDGALFIAGFGDGTYNLSGGTLEIGGDDLIARYNNTSSVSTFNLGGSANGATVKAIGSALNTSVDWNLVAGTANKEKGTKINTNGLGATLSGNIYGALGGIVKTGSDTLTLSGATRNVGYFNTDQGTTIQSTGVTTSAEFVVGSNYSAKNGEFILNGGSIVMSGSTPDAPTPSLRVGDWGGTGVLTQNAGTVTVGGVGIAAALNIGNQGGSGIYNLNGGTLTLAGGLNILGRSSGSNPASTGVLNITGGLLDITNNSSLINGNNFNVANLGTGTINQSGGILRVSEGALYIAGFGNGTYNLSGGTLEIGGNDLVARYNNTASVSTFNLGGSANGATVKAIGSALNTSVDWNLVAGTANKEKGTKINTNGLGATLSGNIYGALGGIVKTGSGDLLLGGSTRNVGYFNVDEGTTTQSAGTTTTSEFVVGSNYSAKNGEFILNGGTVAISGTTSDSPVPTLRVGDWGGTGVFTQNGGIVNVGLLGEAALNIGNQGGSGTYNLNGGTLTLAGGNNVLGLSSGSNPTSTGVLNISGGLLDILNGSALINGNNSNVANLGTGTINQSGGTLRVSDGALYIAGFGNGTYNLSGGTLEVGGNSLVARYNNSSSVSTFNLGGSANGATVKAIGSALNTSVDWNLVDGTANKEKGTKINTNSLGATLSGNLYGLDGGIVKTGSGDLLLSGSTRNVGYFNVDEGTTTQSAGTTTTSEFVVGSNYSAKNGEFILNGGTVAISGTTSDSPVPTLRVGDWGGTGVFTQNGGIVNVGLLGEAALNIGNQGGSGTYNLNGGTLTLAGGNNVLGRSSGSNPTSTGVLNISGGLLDILNSSALINGNNFNVANLGTGTINQSGGILRVSDGRLYIAGFGNGTYNLSGGTLEVGGNSLVARYNNSSSVSTFNLGGSANGATVKAVGSALNTSVDWNLVNGTANKEKGTKINTNNLGATLSGNIFGADGGIVKTGSGDLLLNGTTRNVGYFNVDEGTATQSAGTTTTSEFVVGSNYSAKNGEFILNGGTVAISGTTSDSPVPTLRVGDWGGEGVFTQNGGAVNVGLLGDAALNIGNQGGFGTYNLNGGTLVLAGGNNVLGRSTGASPASTGVLNISGGLLEIANGSSLINGNNFGDANLGTGTINQTGGTLRVSDGSLYIAGFGNGTYNLSGGTLEVGGNSLVARYNNSSSISSFNLGGSANGATVKAIGSTLNTSVDWNLVDETANKEKATKIDTNGLGAMLAGNIAGIDGGIVKIGSGDLALSGSTRNVGYLNIDEGTATQSAGTTTTSEFVVGSNYSAKDGTFIQNGGTVAISGATSDSPVPTLRVGDFGGTGVFTQNSGTVNVGLLGEAALNIGNQGGSGTYNLNGGTLTLAGGNNVLGRSTGANPASTGVLNISGGLLDITNGSALINGNNSNVVSLGTGTINQTGGTLRVSDGSLYVAGFGNGTYNLNGGTLEVGGTGLAARYNNITSVSSFNLGGGTVKVIGTALDTDASPVLKPSSTSTIDTNGLGAHFNNGIQGTGTLRKTGAGDLEISGASSAGTLLLTSGKTTFHDTLSSTGDVELSNGADLVLDAPANSILGDLTVGGGSKLFGSAASGGSTSILSGGSHNLGLGSTTATGSYSLSSGAELRMELLPDISAARLNFTGGISLQSGSTLVLFAPISFQPLSGSTYLLFTSVVPMDLGGAQIIGEGSLAGYNLSLGNDGILSVTAIPEPHTVALAALAGLAILGARLRRKS